MSDEVKGRNVKVEQTARIGKEQSEDVVSVARRRAMKIGLSAVPVILTLRGKPLFAQTTDSVAASLAAGGSLQP